MCFIPENEKGIYLKHNMFSTQCLRKNKSFTALEMEAKQKKFELKNQNN